MSTCPYRPIIKFCTSTLSFYFSSECGAVVCRECVLVERENPVIKIKIIITELFIDGKAALFKVVTRLIDKNDECDQRIAYTLIEGKRKTCAKLLC